MNAHRTHAPRRSRRQAGFSLIVVLIVLIVVSLLGVSASQMVLLSERSTRFDRDYQIAYQGAEAALMDAEFDIRGPNADANNRVAEFSPQSNLGFTEGCGSSGKARGLCLPAAPGAKEVWYTVDFTDETSGAKATTFGEFTGRSLDIGGTGARPSVKPHYIIEAIEDRTPGTEVGKLNILHRVTAMGFGPRTETIAVVQMIFRKE